MVCRSVKNEDFQPPLEVAEIFRRYWNVFYKSFRLTPDQKKAAWAIRDCRTESMGWHVERCSNKACGHEVFGFNSCRNRFCNKCGANNRLRWVTQRLDELLPIHYYHVVCTMPAMLRLLSRFNMALFFDMFFKATSYALNFFAEDPRYLGAQLGYVGVLHTWGQRLAYHPHIHFIVSGGGLAYDKSYWAKLPYTKKFLFPAKAVSRVIRKRFDALLEKAYAEGKVRFPGQLSTLSSPNAFKQFRIALLRQAWYCYAKPPFGGPEKVVEYLGRYVHRVAISNHRLIKVEGGRVYFEWRDYKDDYRVKVTSLSVLEFIRRYLLHVLPRGFRKVRHFGFLSPGNRTLKLGILSVLFSGFESRLEGIKEKWSAKIERYIDHLCPVCGIGHLSYYFNTS